MISDESSSDSETGRFKCRSKPEEQKNSARKDDSRASGRGRPSENDRFRREFERKRDERDRHGRRSRERYPQSRHSPIRRRSSRERSPKRRSRERDRPRHEVDSRARSKPRERRSNSKEKRPHSKSRSHRSPEQKKIIKEEVKIRERRTSEAKLPSLSPERNSKFNRKARDSSSPEYHTNRSQVRKASPSEAQKKKDIDIPVELDEHSSESDEVVATGSYYQMAPTVVVEKKRDDKSTAVVEKKRDDRSSPVEKRKDDRSSAVEKRKDDDTTVDKKEFKKATEVMKKKKDDKLIDIDQKKDGEDTDISKKRKEEKSESSEIDSSDDERLRAKLLNLERELHRTRRKKHKKKHKRSSTSKSRDQDPSTVEVTSTTDIDKVKPDSPEVITESVEVTSTEKGKQKESSEEGEILSDDNSADGIEIEPTDLRHKLKRTLTKSEKSAQDACGPALPPHLIKRQERSSSRDIEGPALPPHLQQNKSKHVGPTIPDDIRQRLAEVDPKDIRYESSDEDDGIGPLPADSQAIKWSAAHQRLEARALDMKIKNLEGRSSHREAKSREQWMLELPEGKAKILGLEARTFRAKAGPDMSDRSSWTDTPEEKARKLAGLSKREDPEEVLQREAKSRQIANRDEEQEKAVKKHKKKHKRDDSLLELHQKKLKKKKKKEDRDEDKKERRPFSRDVDLQVNRFDEAQKRSIIKKAQELDTRFGRGEAKFL